MEIKLNFFERILMKLGYLLSDAGRKIRESVYKKYDKDLHYRNRGYNPKKRNFGFKRNSKKRVLTRTLSFIFRAFYSSYNEKIIL